MNSNNSPQNKDYQEENLSFYEKMLKDLGETDATQNLIYRISYELGGQRFYVPAKIKKTHFFSDYGEEFFNWLVKTYKGNTIIFPCGINSTYKRNKTQAEILARRGFSSNEIARQLGIHYRSAQRAKKSSNNKQRNLFYDEQD